MEDFSEENSDTEEYVNNFFKNYEDEINEDYFYKNYYEPFINLIFNTTYLSNQAKKSFESNFLETYLLDGNDEYRNSLKNKILLFTPKKFCGIFKRPRDMYRLRENDLKFCIRIGDDSLYRVYNDCVKKIVSYMPLHRNTNKKILRIMAIEGVTGLKYIKDAFIDCDCFENYSPDIEKELLIKFLNKKYNFSSCVGDVYYFIVNTIGFSHVSLKCINSNYKEFYYGMSVEKGVEIILKKLFECL